MARGEGGPLLMVYYADPSQPIYLLFRIDQHVPLQLPLDPVKTQMILMRVLLMALSLSLSKDWI